MTISGIEDIILPQISGTGGHGTPWWAVFPD